VGKILLTGPAGSGKTHRVLDEFVEALKTSPDPLADDLFFLVPSAEHTERITALAVQRGIPGFFRRRVTTLSRLFEDIFHLGRQNFISESGRFFILREILDGSTWPYFSALRGSPGVLSLLLAFISELKESMISPAVFREKMNALKQLEADLSAKYEALAGLYEAYAAALERQGLKDRQDALLELLERADPGHGKNPVFRKVWLDGFYDFSPLQLACLKRLSEMTGGVVVTLTLEESGKRRDLFEPVEETAVRLEAIGFAREKSARKVREPLNAALALAGERLFSGAPGSAKVKPGEAITVFEAVGLEGEMEMVAREILGHEATGRYRFSDFAILLRQIGEYESVVRSVFAKYGVPVEIHERERLGFAPMMQVVVRLLKIFQDGWKRSDLMEFLKSNYVRSLGAEARDYEWVAALEHEAAARGITGGRDAWLEPWTQGRLGALAGLEDELRGAQNIVQIRSALVRAVEETFRVFERADSTSDYVRRDAASYRRFDSILREIGIALPRGSQEAGAAPGALFEQFTARFFRLVELDLFPLHENNRNKVQVYNVSLAREKDYKIVFISGLLERKFPVQIKEDPVLADWERGLFSRLAGPGELAQRAPRQRLERYLFYLAVTRAREKLVLTYPRFDLEGKEALRSWYVDEVVSLFETPVTLKSQDLGRPYPAPEEAASRRDLELAVMGKLWEAGSKAPGEQTFLLALLNRLFGDGQSAGRFKRAFYEVHDELLDPAIAQTGAFRPTVTSATSLEMYAKCPFKYYAANVLKLKDTDEEVNVKARGSILHKVLELCFVRWAAQPALMRDKPRAIEEAQKTLERVLGEFPLVTEKRYQYDLEIEDLQRMLASFLGEELDRLIQAPLRPLYFEYAFGLPENPQAPALEISDGAKKILVRGKIDRIDVDASGKAATVLDYKRTAQFKRKHLELGISLQLPLYAAYLEKYLGLRCVGAELYSIKERAKKGFYRKGCAELIGKKSARAMILDDGAFDALLAGAAESVRKISRGMEGMKIDVRPRDEYECSHYCPYAPVCRIEKWRLALIAKEENA
jgi:ATP-dependent helicase/nuclease subunit B